MMVPYKIKRFLLGIFGILAGLLIAEGLARCLLPYPARQIALLRTRAPDLQMDAGTDLKNPGYNPFLQRRPFSEWICDGKSPERMNNEGFRDRDFIVAKSPDKIRLAVLGDSFTEGWMVDRMAAFPRVIESDLQPYVEVLNFGLANRSPLRYVALYREIVRKYHPDIVLVCLYCNDLGEDEALRNYVIFDAAGVPVHFDYERYFHHTPRMPQTKWEKRLDKWQWIFCQHSRLYPYLAAMLTVDSGFRKRILETPSPHSFPFLWKNTASYLFTLKEMLGKDGAKFLLAYVPDAGDFASPNQLYDGIQQFAADMNIPFPPVKSFLTATDSKALYLVGDGHFSPQGHSLYGHELSAWLKTVLPRK